MPLFFRVTQRNIGTDAFCFLAVVMYARSECGQHCSAVSIRAVNRTLADELHSNLNSIPNSYDAASRSSLFSAAFWPGRLAQRRYCGA
jgi:hypothetical protein